MDSSRERLILALIRESLSVVSSGSIVATKSLISLIIFLVELVQSLTNQTPLSASSHNLRMFLFSSLSPCLHSLKEKLSS